MLSSSLLSVVFSYFIFGEKLSLGQIASGLVLLLGSSIVLWTSEKKAPAVREGRS
jgi:drug/metabolite transporter (DMT)-like permease